MEDVLRVGFGEDAHRLAAERPLWLGGVAIADAPRGAVAHSDGDALIHALADAMLSAWGAGDIGGYFPPSDPAYRGLAGAELLGRIQEILHPRVGPIHTVNLAAVVTLDHPRLHPHRDAIRTRLSGLLAVAPTRVNVAFKTSEGLAPDHVQARVTVLVAGAGPGTPG